MDHIWCGNVGSVSTQQHTPFVGARLSIGNAGAFQPRHSANDPQMTRDPYIQRTSIGNTSTGESALVSWYRHGLQLTVEQWR
eukprot:474949-Alexandrium_andersonii.AAC.1